MTPQFFVLDKDRIIRYTGAMDDNQNEAKVTKKYVRDAVDAVLKGETVEVDRDPAPRAAASATRRSNLDRLHDLRRPLEGRLKLWPPPIHPIGGGSLVGTHRPDRFPPADRRRPPNPSVLGSSRTD